jgi:CheY-like chemotaxis protein
MNSERILKGLRVVVVDNDADNLELLKVIFELCNAQVIAVLSVTEAIEISRQWNPNIILSDIAMPNLDGYWLIRHIRNLKSPVRRIPIIAVTALASTEQRSLIFESGFSERILKPFDPNELITVVSRMILKTKLNSCLRQYKRKNYRLTKLTELKTLRKNI